MVNKFLYPNGGSETYMFKLGAYLKSIGHKVEYFGMEHEGRCVSNSLGLYTETMDFHNSSALKKIKLSLKTIYSKEAKDKMLAVLENFKPDVVHLNNFNFQLTPSIIYAVKEKGIALVETVHDCQIACPNHRMYIEHKSENCDACLGGNYFNCAKNKCVHNSAVQSLLAAAESYIYHKKNTYNLVDRYICPSNYMKETIAKGGIEESRLTVLHNFIEKNNKDISDVIIFSDGFENSFNYYNQMIDSLNNTIREYKKNVFSKYRLEKTYDIYLNKLSKNKSFDDISIIFVNIL